MAETWKADGDREMNEDANMIQTGKLVKVYVYLKGKRHEIEPDEARALLAQLKAALGDPAQYPVYIPVPQLPQPVQPIPMPSPTWPPYLTTTCGSPQ